MATKYPGAQYRPLGPQTEPRMTAHDIICHHTMVGSLTGTDSMFHDQGYGGTESHFGIGGDGTDYQWQDLDYQADANLDGNPRVISIETADHGAPFAKWTGENVPAWTTEQINEIVELDVWLCRKYSIPAVLVPDSRPGRRGLAYHRQGIDPWRVSGGEKWSSSRGKVCPGDRRIFQLRTIIVPRVRAILAGANLNGGTTVNFTDSVPGLIDPDGTPVTVGEALVRGNWAYRSVTEGGSTDDRLDILEQGN